MYEIKKMLLYKKGLLVLILAVFIQLLSILLPVGENKNTEDDRFYLKQVRGAYTEEKAAYLEEEAVRISNAKAEREILLDNYYDGKLKKHEFDEKKEELDEILKHEQQFEEIYEQYLYISQDKERRCFIETEGWEALFAGSSFSFFAAITILLLTVPVFCGEYQAQMDVLILTSQGGRNSSRQKIGMAVLAALLVCLVFALIFYVGNLCIYGLHDGNFPLQSIERYQTSGRQLSLNQGYLWLSLFRCIGGMFFAVIILLLSVFLKKSALVVFLSSASIVLPYLGMTAKQIYKLPIPIAFLLGDGFLQGNQFDVDGLTGETILTFQEIPEGYICVMLLLSMLVCTAGSILIIKKTSNLWHPSGFRIKAACMGIFFLMVCLLSGCGMQEYVEDRSVDVYNTSVSERFESDDLKVYFDDLDRMPVLRNLNTGTVETFIRDPLAILTEDVTIMPFLFWTDSAVYYIRIDTGDYMKKAGHNKSRVEKVSLVETSFEYDKERVIFEKIASTGRSFLGIEYETDDRWDFLLHVTGFFVSDRSLFFLTNDGIYEVDRRSNHITLLPIFTVKNIAFRKNIIYYINQDSVLCQYDTAAKTSSQVLESAVSDFFLETDQLFYINRQDKHTVYVYDFQTEMDKKLTDQPALSIVADDGQIYFVGKDDGLKYKMGFDGSDLERISDGDNQ